MLKKAFILPEIALHRTLEACRASAQGRSAGAGNAERGGGPSEHPRSGRGSGPFFTATFFPATQRSCPLCAQPGTEQGEAGREVEGTGVVRGVSRQKADSSVLINLVRAEGRESQLLAV